MLSEIAIGRFRPGDALPPEHNLAEIMEVSRSTLRQTLGDLEREGVIHRIQGKGTYVSEVPMSDAGARSASFALIVPDVASGYYPSLVAGFDKAATEAGRPMVVCNTHNDVDKQASHLIRLIDQRVAGILLNPSTRSVTPASQIRVAQDAGIPVVFLHRGIADSQAPVLELPSREIGHRAGQLMLEAGHRRVAYLATHRYSVSEAYEQGLRESLTDVGLDLPPHMLHYGNMTRFDAEANQAHERYLEQLLREMFGKSDRPTAIFSGFDLSAEMVYLIAGRLGIRVPEDLSIVCFGGARREGAIMRRLTTITVDEAEVASQAVTMLVEMCEGRRPIRSQEMKQISLGISLGETLLNISQ